jgi:putative ABC transport system substrate-binding protein
LRRLVPSVLRELGCVDGRNLVVERRFASGKIDRLPELARELVQLQVDVIFALTDAVETGRDARTTIPIVMIFGGDPVARGWARSLSRRGGNITGVTTVAETVLAGKRLELFREAVPRATTIAVVVPAGSGMSGAQLQEAQKAASALRVKLVVVEVQGIDHDRAFATMVAERADGLFVLMSPTLTRDQKLIIGRAAKYRLPAIYEWREQVEGAA